MDARPEGRTLGRSDFSRGNAIGDEINSSHLIYGVHIHDRILFRLTVLALHGRAQVRFFLKRRRKLKPPSKRYVVARSPLSKPTVCPY